MLPRSGANASLVLSSLVFEYTCDAIVLVDSELYVRALNPAAQALLGWRQDDLAGKALCRTVVRCDPEVERGPRAPRSAPCLCERVVATHCAAANTRLRIRPGGRALVVSASAAPLPVDHVGGAVLALRVSDDQTGSLAEGPLSAGELRMDTARHRVLAGARIVRLTPTNYELLRHLLANANRVMTQQDLVERIWRLRDANGRDLLKTHVAALRKCLRDAGVGGVSIENVYGVGYMLTTPADPAPPEPSAPAPGTAGDWW